MISQMKFEAMLSLGAIEVTEGEDRWMARWNYILLEKYFPDEFEDIIRESIVDATQQVLFDEGMIAPVVVDKDNVEFKTTMKGKQFQKLLTTVYRN